MALPVQNQQWGMLSEENVPVVDDLYDEHLEQLRREGLIDG